MRDDVQTLRRENLRKLSTQHGGVVKLGEKLGYTNGSFIVQMCGPNPIRVVTERSARRFEKRLGLPRGTLDGIAPNIQVVDQMVIELVRATATALDESKVEVSASKFADILILAYEKSVAAGKVDENFIKSVVGLLRP